VSLYLSKTCYLWHGARAARLAQAGPARMPDRRRRPCRREGAGRRSRVVSRTNPGHLYWCHTPCRHATEIHIHDRHIPTSLCTGRTSDITGRLTTTDNDPRQASSSPTRTTWADQLRTLERPTRTFKDRINEVTRKRLHARGHATLAFNASAD